MTDQVSPKPPSQVLLERVTVAYCAVLPLDIIPFAFGRSLTAPVLVLLVLFWLHSAHLTGRAIAVHPCFLALAYLLVVWCVVTLIWTRSWPASELGVATLVVQIVTVLAMSPALAIPQCRQKCIRWLTHGTVILAFWVLLSPANAVRQGRASIGGVDENLTGLVLTVGFAAGTYCLLIMKPRPNAAVLILELLFIVAATLRGGSRTAVVAVAMTMLVASALAFRTSGSAERASLIRGWMLASVAGATYASLVVSGRVPQRVVDFVASPAQANDSARADIIDRYQRFQGEWIWHGVGYGADSSFLTSVGAGYQNAHSLLWKTWIETGLIGVAILGALLLFLLWHAWRGPDKRASVLLLTAPIATYAITLGGDRVSIFWFVVALAATETARPSKPGLAGSAVVQRPLKLAVDHRRC